MVFNYYKGNTTPIKFLFFTENDKKNDIFQPYELKLIDFK